MKIDDIRKSRAERRAEILRDVAMGRTPTPSFGDAVTLYVFLGIVVLLLAWFLSGSFLWSFIVVAVLVAGACALTWWFRQRRGRRGADVFFQQ